MFIQRFPRFLSILQVSFFLLPPPLPLRLLVFKPLSLLHQFFSFNFISSFFFYIFPSFSRNQTFLFFSFLFYFILFLTSFSSLFFDFFLSSPVLVQRYSFSSLLAVFPLSSAWTISLSSSSHAKFLSSGFLAIFSVINLLLLLVYKIIPWYRRTASVTILSLTFLQTLLISAQKIILLGLGIFVYTLWVTLKTIGQWQVLLGGSSLLVIRSTIIHFLL